MTYQKLAVAVFLALSGIVVLAQSSNVASGHIDLPVAAPATNNAISITDMDADIKVATDLVNAGQFLEARVKLDGLLGHAPESVRPRAEDILGRVHIELLMTPRAMPEKIQHSIKSGETLGRLARQHGTTEELIQKSNGITDKSLIKVGYRLRICTGKFQIRVSTSRNEMVVTMNGRFFKRYRVGTGKAGTTPKGEFLVQDRVIEPVWWRSDGKAVPFGDKENILGTRWLSFKSADTNNDVRGYGIHGTWDESTIGQAVSSGCVRMRNADVEELFTYIPAGTLVIVEE